MESSCPLGPGIKGPPADAFWQLSCEQLSLMATMMQCLLAVGSHIRFYLT